MERFRIDQISYSVVVVVGCYCKCDSWIVGVGKGKAIVSLIFGIQNRKHNTDHLAVGNCLLELHGDCGA